MKSAILIFVAFLLSCNNPSSTVSKNTEPLSDVDPTTASLKIQLIGRDWMQPDDSIELTNFNQTDSSYLIHHYRKINNIDSLLHVWYCSFTDCIIYDTLNSDKAFNLSCAKGATEQDIKNMREIQITIDTSRK
jgi:hypothetical protein